MRKKKKDLIAMYHYKDKNPRETIRRIEGILSHLGIHLISSITNAGAGKLHSIHLRLAGSDFNIGTNGKGISRDLAFASAYAEFMERLQNQWLCDIEQIYRIDNNFVRAFGFYRAPDEKYISVPQLLRDLPEELLYHFFSKETRDSITVPAERFLLNSVFMHKGKCITIPYYSFKRKKTVNVPLSFLKETNGMCAGNTPEEALTQGISEIIERHVMREILFKGINPPVIPHGYLKEHFPEMYALITHLEAREGLRFIVKDCSFNGLFPVIGVIMMNRNRNGYFVSLGAHPVLSIAIERAFTDLFQGRRLAGFPYVSFEFSHEGSRQMNKWLAWCKNFRSGGASYQAHLFTEVFSYPFSRKGPPLLFKNNHECFTYLLNLLRSMNWDILVRDVSFLGFPSYHVIIPEAQLGCFNRCPYEKPDNFYHISDLLHKLQQCSTKEIEIILQYLEKAHKTGARRVFSKSLNIVLKDTEKLKLFDRLLPAALYYKLGRFSEAHAHFSKLIGEAYTDRQNYTPVYRCARDFISMVQAKTPIKEITGMLKKFYKEEQLFVVTNLFLADMKWFREFTDLPCFNCSECGCQLLCKYPVIRKLHLKIKQVMRKNKIAQETVADIFSRVNARVNN